MRVFLLILVLIFSIQSYTKADDISDFQIEGISLGDSVLDYYSEEKILNAEKIFLPKSKKFHRIVFILDNTDLYDAVAFYVRSNDKKYKIYALEGFKYFNYISCKAKQKEIAKNLREMFSDYNENSYEEIHSFDSESTFFAFDFGFDDGSVVRIICTDWTNKMENDGYKDSLAVYLYKAKFRKWLNTEAY